MTASGTYLSVNFLADLLLSTNSKKSILSILFHANIKKAERYLEMRWIPLWWT